VRAHLPGGELALEVMRGLTDVRMHGPPSTCSTATTSQRRSLPGQRARASFRLPSLVTTRHHTAGNARSRSRCCPDSTTCACTRRRLCSTATTSRLRSGAGTLMMTRASLRLPPPSTPRDITSPAVSVARQQFLGFTRRYAQDAGDMANRAKEPLFNRGTALALSRATT
jgi:hypothetical protein